MKKFDYQDEMTELHNRAEAYLRERGWRYTSSTPACYWLWVREMPEHAATKDVPAGTLILTDREMALAMQDRIDYEERLRSPGFDE